MGGEFFTQPLFGKVVVCWVPSLFLALLGSDCCFVLMIVLCSFHVGWQAEKERLLVTHLQFAHALRWRK